MDTKVFDLYSEKDRKGRYDVNKTTLYEKRLSILSLIGLGQQFKKGGNVAYVNEEQLKALDSLNVFLSNGGTVEDFLFERYGIGEGTNRTGIVKNDSEQSQLNQFLMLAQAFQQLQQTQKGILDNYEQLEKCCQNRWLIPTSKLAQLMEISPNTIRGERIERFGFVAIKTSEKARESIWKIEKRSEL